MENGKRIFSLLVFTCIAYVIVHWVYLDIYWRIGSASINLSAPILISGMFRVRPKARILFLIPALLGDILYYQDTGAVLVALQWFAPSFLTVILFKAFVRQPVDLTQLRQLVALAGSSILAIHIDLFVLGFIVNRVSAIHFDMFHHLSADAGLLALLKISAGRIGFILSIIAVVPPLMTFDTESVLRRRDLLELVAWCAAFTLLCVTILPQPHPDAFYVVLVGAFMMTLRFEFTGAALSVFIAVLVPSIERYWVLHRGGSLLARAGRTSWDTWHAFAGKVPLSPLHPFYALTTIVAFTVGSRLRQRRRLERELERAKAAAEELATLKSAFFAEMSHELRTPVASLTLSSQLLSRQPAGSEDHRDTVKRIGASGEMLLAMLNNVLDFSKLEAGAMRLHSETVELRPFIETILQSLEDRAAANSVTLIKDLAADFPNTVSIDRFRVQQVLVNLLANAIRYSSSASVRLTMRCEDDHMHFAIIDTGSGVAVEKRDLLFRPYGQAGTPDDARMGSGLGLIISKSLVHLMGGQIGYEPGIDKGSTFWFTIPLARPAERNRVIGAKPDRSRTPP